MSVEFALDYPFRAPQVRPTGSFVGEGANDEIKFKTKMYHPNIDSDGSYVFSLLGNRIS
jgi:ubiquitin-protein ligase